MKRHLFAGAVVAFATLPLAAAAQSPNGAPVTINTCAAIIDNNATSNSNAPSIGGVSLTAKSEGLRIQFTNNADKTADVINFNVNSNGQAFVIRDVGTFSPGIEIDHKFRNGAGQAFVLPQFFAPKIDCSVASVRFTDGTIWQPATGMQGPQPPGTANLLQANPASVSVAAGADGQVFLVSSSHRIAAFTERDNCQGVATVAIAATGQSTAAYRVVPLATGSCSATIVDQLGNTLRVPITVR